MSTSGSLVSARPAGANGETFNRRNLLKGAAGTAAALAAAGLVRQAMLPTAEVFIARNQRYDGPLARTIRDGLLATGFQPAAVAGRRVLLKPNLVEPARATPQLTTNPAVVLAAAETFQRWGAEVFVAEAPGHVRDTEMALAEARLGEALDSASLEFVDINYRDTTWVKNAGRASPLAGFHFPQVVVAADLIVSLPKMKTHHWVGMTAALKNMYGVLPGIKYGWPKNVLHHVGIPETVVDINASLPRIVTIVDGIVCMEGDGPIMGSPKTMGLLVVGTNSTAVDATCGRIMGFDPHRVSYLKLAADRLGPVAEGRILQRGEPWREVASPFSILDEPHLRCLRAGSGVLTTWAEPRPAAHRWHA